MPFVRREPLESAFGVVPSHGFCMSDSPKRSVPQSSWKRAVVVSWYVRTIETLSPRIMSFWAPPSIASLPVPPISRSRSKLP